MDTDRPSQEGREDVPSELSFLVSAAEADPTLVCDAFERGDSPGTNLILHYVTRTGGPCNKCSAGNATRTGNDL